MPSTVKSSVGQDKPVHPTFGDISTGQTLYSLSLLLLALGALLSTVAFVWAFTISPMVYGEATSVPALIGGKMVTNMLLFSQKIFYFHVPVALMSFVWLAVAAVFAMWYLRTRQADYDLRSRIASELALVFILMTMASGEMWERFDWGIWWTWEPRLTTYFIMMLMVIGYFVLRAAVTDPERQATYASVFVILAFVNAPISLIITRLVPTSIHPVVFRTDSGLPPMMLIPFLLAICGMTMVAFGLYQIRLREQRLALLLESLKAKLAE